MEIKDEELLERIEKAAKDGARKGSKSGGIISKLISLAVVLLIVCGGVYYIRYSFQKGWSDFKEQFTFESEANSHDMVLEDEGFLGYTAADFADAVLGDTKQLKKMEVYEAEIADVVTLTDTGLANLKIFSKTQLITYNGIATYTVDLSKLTEDDFKLDEEEKTLTVYIPHAKRETINIPSDKMEFGDTEKGWLAFGDISMTAAQLSEVETEARSRMEDKLEELNESENADKFAKMTVWELYQPLVSNVSAEYKLEVDFK